MGVIMKKWMQEESQREEKAGTKGALREYFGIKEGETIPTSKLKTVAARLHTKAEKEGGLSAKELRLSREINMALRYRKE
jgi:hypothetical protein